MRYAAKRGIGRSFLIASLALAAAFLAPDGSPPPAAEVAGASTLPSGFVETTVFSGLTHPMVVRFAPDGRVFVAEKSGLIKVFDSLSDTTPTTFADLRTNVYNFWDRGLLGLALDPNFPANPYVYVLYAYDHVLGDLAPAPKWGSPGATSDPCPSPPGPTSDGCVVSGRLSRLQASGNVMTGSEQVLIEDWCQQYPSHSVGSIEFGPDGALYASSGDGASFEWVDYGQDGNPLNPCGDPPGSVGSALTPPSAEGGALRSQDLRTPSDPAGLDGSIIRVDPATGAALPSNPNGASADANARRIIAYGLRNPFRFTFRPGTSELWIGDVGWVDWEEINRILSPTDALVENFGWPCYEANSRQSGYDSADLSICENLYGNANADTKPYFAYHHSSKVVAGESCPTGSSSISGLSFEFAPSGSTFPSEYQGALFFADYSRDCIWAMERNGNPIPSPGSIKTFVAQAANPVNLEFGPDGNLYYVDFDGGTIRRVAPGSSEPPPSCPIGQYGAQYFSNVTLSGAAALTRCETSVNYDWGLGSPGAPIPSDTFSARWTGDFDFPAGDATFTATADDGIRVWVDGSLVIDGWRDQGPTTYSGTRTLTAGTHQVKIEYYENAGGAVARVSWSTSPVASCPLGQFRARYYANTTFADPIANSACEAAVSYDWGTGSPSGLPSDLFSARWIGDFDFPAGDATFMATADDGIRVWVDGSLVIDGWRDQAPTTYSGTRALTAGTHQVKIEYYENAGGAVARVSWTTGGATIPAVTDRTPASGATGVALDVAPTATFSEAMDPATLTPNTFTLVKQGTTTPLAATVSYANLTATLDPGSSLEPSSTYVVTVVGGSAGAKDTGGTALANDVNWTFTTAAAPVPNQPPAPAILGPQADVTWKVGDAISFSGSAIDPEQGQLSSPSLTWTLLMQHCPSNCHSHTLQTWTGVATGSFTAPDHEYPSYLELQLTATDASGASATTSVSLQPTTVILDFSSMPSGLQLAVNGSSSTTPFSRTVIIGSSNSVSATTPQVLSGTTYEFSSWSDAGAQTHNLTASASRASYSATYVIAPPRNTVLPGISGQARIGRVMTVSDGVWTGSQPISFRYQWSRCTSTTIGSCTPISGATAKSYTVAQDDSGLRLRATVTATNAGGSASATSGASGRIR